VWVYCAAVVVAPLLYVFALTKGVPNAVWPWYAGVTALSLVPAGMLVAGLWNRRKMLEPVSGITIVVNLATTAVLLAAFWQRG
jgi:hypothetical protein